MKTSNPAATASPDHTQPPGDAYERWAKFLGGKFNGLMLRYYANGGPFEPQVLRRMREDNPGSVLVCSIPTACPTLEEAYMSRSIRVEVSPHPLPSEAGVDRYVLEDNWRHVPPIVPSYVRELR